jgi:DNA helicase HerA-like ATPase
MGGTSKEKTAGDGVVVIEKDAFETPEEAFRALGEDSKKAGGEFKPPASHEGCVAKTMFDLPNAKDGTVTILMPRENIDDLPSQALVRIESEADKRTYLGAVVAGPFAEPDGIRADSTPLVVTLTKGTILMPKFHGRAQVEIIGEKDGDTLIPPRRRPKPNSPVFTLSAEDTKRELKADGDFRIGQADGFEDLEVGFDSKDKGVLPRHLGVLGTTGGGKSVTVSGMIAKAQEKGIACIVLDLEGEYCAINEPTSELRMKRALEKRRMEPKGVPNTHILYPVGRSPKNDKHPSKASFSLRFANLSPYTFKEILDLSDAQEERFFKAYDVTKAVMQNSAFNLISTKGKEKLLTYDELSEGYPDMKFSFLYDVVAQVAAIANEDSDPDYLMNQVFKDKREDFKKAINAAINASKKKSGGDAASWRALLGKLGRVKRLNIFDNPSADPLDYSKLLEAGKVSIVDLSDVDTPQIKNLVIADLLRGVQENQDVLYEKAIKSGGAPTPVLIFIEEAHEFLSAERIRKMEVLFEQVARIARRGRKRWLGLVFITQLPQHLPDEVFGLINNWVLHKISDSTVLNRLKKAVGGINESLWDRLPSLAQGQALTSFSTWTRPLQVNIDPTPCKLLMTT